MSKTYNHGRLGASGHKHPMLTGPAGASRQSLGNATASANNFKETASLSGSVNNTQNQKESGRFSFLQTLSGLLQSRSRSRETDRDPPIANQ